MVYLARKFIPDAKEEEKKSFIDERLLNTPTFALAECDNYTVKMAKIASLDYATATDDMTVAVRGFKM